MAFLLILPMLAVPDGSRGEDGAFAEWGERIERAHYGSDIGALRRLAEEMEQTRQDTWQELYCLGFVHADIGVLLDRAEKDGAREHYDRALALLARADSIDGNAEVRALAAYVTGNTMNHVSFFGKIGVGRRAGSWLDRAREADSTNHRVWLVDGISRIYRPGFAGGGADRARERFGRALELLEGWEPDENSPTFWGGAGEVYAWWGYLEIREGNYENARRCLEYALSVRPEYVWVKGELLPLLEEKSGE